MILNVWIVFESSKSNIKNWNYVIHMQNNNENLKLNDNYTFVFDKSMNHYNSKLKCNLNIKFANSFQICYCSIN